MSTCRTVACKLKLLRTTVAIGISGWIEWPRVPPVASLREPLIPRIPRILIRRSDPVPDCLHGRVGAFVGLRLIQGVGPPWACDNLGF